MSITESQKIVWEDEYSVGVKLIDDQHKMFFSIINELVEAINNKIDKETITGILEQLVQYKKFHFATEERYFKEFNYENTDDHMARHREFNAHLKKIKEKNDGDMLTLSFDLVDFIEDWFVKHILNIDQQYKECFRSHGLK